MWNYCLKLKKLNLWPPKPLNIAMDPLEVLKNPHIGYVIATLLSPIFAKISKSKVCLVFYKDPTLRHTSTPFMLEDLWIGIGNYETWGALLTGVEWPNWEAIRRHLIFCTDVPPYHISQTSGPSGTKCKNGRKKTGRGAFFAGKATLGGIFLCCNLSRGGDNMLLEETISGQAAHNQLHNEPHKIWSQPFNVCIMP